MLEYLEPLFFKELLILYWLFNLWKPELCSLHITSDSLIALFYFQFAGLLHAPATHSTLCRNLYDCWSFHLG